MFLIITALLSLRKISPANKQIALSNGSHMYGLHKAEGDLGQHYSTGMLRLVAVL
jgi:hypothetical protein